jgi:hypothetical protein
VIGLFCLGASVLFVLYCIRYPWVRHQKCVPGQIGLRLSDRDRRRCAIVLCTTYAPGISEDRYLASLMEVRGRGCGNKINLGRCHSMGLRNLEPHQRTIQIIT